jgi:hypothetical protein
MRWAQVREGRRDGIGQGQSRGEPISLPGNPHCPLSLESYDYLSMMVECQEGLESIQIMKTRQYKYDYAPTIPMAMVSSLLIQTLKWQVSLGQGQFRF